MRDDLRAAFRSLRKSPTFTAVALAVLALGIGSGTAVFSVVDAVVLRGLPFDEHDRLAVVLEADPTGKEIFGGGSTTPQTYLDWRRLQEGFEGLAATTADTFHLKTDTGEPADARAYRVTWEFFQALRVAPLHGRTFTADDEIEGRHRVAILSYGFWQRRFGGDPAAVGRILELDDVSYEVVGVMPQGFEYPVASERTTEIYAPVLFRQEDKVRGGSRNYNYTVVGRLKDGVSFEQAHQQMDRVAESLDQQHPKWSPGIRTRVISMHEHLVGRVRAWMLMLLAAVGLVLLIACANVANLMLARATTRVREVGIRAALGASRWRLVRGLLIEGLLLSTLGAALGVLLAYFGVQAIRAWLPANLPRVASIGLDLRVLVATTVAAVGSGVVFGIAPALQSSRPDLSNALKDSGRSSTASAASGRLRNALVVVEVALAVVLLVGAGLFVGSFVQLMRVDPGFDYRNVLVLNVGPRVRVTTGGPDLQKAFDEARQVSRTLVPQLREAAAGVPGVVAVGTVSGGLPLSGSWSRNSIELPGRGKLEGDSFSLDRRTVSPEYLRALKVPLLRGRHIESTDTERTEPVIVINEAAAKLYWPGEDAIGKRLTINQKERVVVGIVGNIRHLGPEKPLRQEGYIPFLQETSIGATLVIKTAHDPMAVLPAVKSAIWSVDREQRLTSDIVTLEGYMDRLIRQRRFNMALLAVFGALGLVIAAVGIYGVMACVVAQRTNEIGVRMALGATRARVVSMVLKRAGILMALGLVIGGFAAWMLSRNVEAFLFQTQPTDSRIFAAALAVLTLAGLAASAIPARRAASVDPLVALRHE
ncbi:MAG TPA: ABC transporter permease [Vicinamibacterales bacterium]